MVASPGRELFLRVLIGTAPFIALDAITLFFDGAQATTDPRSGQPPTAQKEGGGITRAALTRHFVLPPSVI
jgi:hypothetical protein